MTQNKPVRVMWLLNHTAARKFEIQMLKAIGINEIFLPKLIPNEPFFRSTSIDWSEDQYLSIPKADLDALNATDWYTGGTRNAWEIANRHFDICFFILYNPVVLKLMAHHFKGALLLRAYGLDKTKSYSQVLDILAPDLGLSWVKKAANRFFLAKAYDHIDRVEPDLFRKRSLYLPLGLHNASLNDQWQGKDKRIFFICPDVGFNPYYAAVYARFVSDFSGMPYAIGGAQAIQIDDPAVLGFTPQAVHGENMRQMRLMFYHSTEPNHIHYHPFEAIRIGMPLVFMAGGLLDRIGGMDLPGRCESIAEAKAKIGRILNDDWALIERIRQSQTVLLEPMKAENCEQAWRDGFRRILSELEISRTERAQRPAKRKRIAVIVPTVYRGGTLRGAKLLAQAIYQGSRQADEAADVVFLHLDDGDNAYPDEAFEDLLPGISCRTFKWKKLLPDVARRAMRFAGYENWEPHAGHYLVAEDGIRQLQDCDLWLVVSDRLQGPLLPLKPYVLLVYDYLQRYFPDVVDGSDQSYLAAARLAERVLVTTRFTQQDALQYAGLPAHKVVRLPILAPNFSADAAHGPSPEPGYFVWTTNLALHKNHVNALKALKWYYENLDGQLDCLVTGVGTDGFLKDSSPHLAESQAMVEASDVLQNRVHWQGELPDPDYQRTLAGSAFLWHAGCIDNGTFSVIEAASLGVPALSSDYPAMREINQQFSLNLVWMDAKDPKAMASQLKQMASAHQAQRRLLPSKAQLAEQGVDRLASAYWKAVRECL